MKWLKLLVLLCPAIIELIEQIINALDCNDEEPVRTLVP